MAFRIFWIFFLQPGDTFFQDGVFDLCRAGLWISGCGCFACFRNVFASAFCRLVFSGRYLFSLLPGPAIWFREYMGVSIIK
jgi:hypothetical protein